MTTLTIEEVRRSIALTTERDQDAQNSLQKVNSEWVSYYKYIDLCKQLIGEHASVNEAFMAVIAAQKICQTFFAILPEETLLELFQICIQCMQTTEFDFRLTTQILKLSALIYLFHPNEMIKSTIIQMEQIFVVLFYTYLGEQMETITILSLENIHQFSTEMYEVLVNFDPSPEWVALFASYTIKLGDLTPLIPLLDKLAAAAAFPESFSFLFNVTSHIFGMPYENLTEEETALVQPFIGILFNTTNTLLHSDSVSNFDIQKGCQYIIETFEYGVQMACCIQNVEFIQSILNIALEIMSHLADYHVELLNTVIALAEFFHGTFELQTDSEESHISNLPEYPYTEQLTLFLSLLFELTLIDDSESESEEVIHSIDLAKAIYSITSIPLDYFPLFEQFLSEVNPGTLFFASYCTDIFKSRFAQNLIQPLLDAQEPVIFAMSFIHKSFVLIRNDQRVGAINYAWQYFLAEQTIENANVVQNCARLGPGFLATNTSIQDFIVSIGENVSSSLVPALYMILMYPTISIPDKEKRNYYINAASELVQNKFMQIAQKGNLGKLLNFMIKFMDHIRNNFSELAMPESFEYVYMKRAKLSMDAYQSSLFPYITQLCQGLLESLGDELFSDDPEVVDAICEVMHQGLTSMLLTPSFVFEWMNHAFESCKTGAIIDLFIANSTSSKTYCLMNYVTPEEVVPFIQELPNLEEEALESAYLFISFLEKIPFSKALPEKTCATWSNEVFLQMFPLELILSILQLPLNGAITKFLPIIEDMFPVSRTFHAPAEWGTEIGNLLLQLVSTTYEEESLIAGIVTLVHLCATSLMDPDQVKATILQAETDQSDIDCFVTLFDMAVEAKVNPVSHLVVKDAYTTLGKIIIYKGRQASSVPETPE